MNTRKRRKTAKAIFWVAALVVTVYAVYTAGLVLLLGDWTKGAVFGESFGALNAFFSGVGLALMAVTLRLQVRELRLQRIEFRMQRREMKKQQLEIRIQRTLLALGAYSQIREEARNTFTTNQSSESARTRILWANSLLARFMDQALLDLEGALTAHGVE